MLASVHFLISLFAFFQAIHKVPLLKRLGEQTNAKLAEVLEEESFKKGEYIVRQGEYGETFYIIMEGQVDVTEYNLETQVEMFIRSMGPGSFFGEQALRNESGKRGANVIARSTVVRCVTLEKKHFLRLIGNRADVSYEGNSRPSSIAVPTPQNKLSNASRLSSSTVSMPVRRMHSEFKSLNLDDLQLEGILGIGGFGRVELVTIKGKSDRSFALKCMKKVGIALIFR